VWPVVMKDKYKNLPLPLQIFHNYTGYIMVVIGLLTIASVFLLYADSLPFFESWSCGQIREYNLGKLDSYGDPKHFELTESEHLRFHQILDECNLKHD
jgi:hypothetical protein